MNLSFNWFLQNWAPNKIISKFNTFYFHLSQSTFKTKLTVNTNNISIASFIFPFFYRHKEHKFEINEEDIETNKKKRREITITSAVNGDFLTDYRFGTGSSSKSFLHHSHRFSAIDLLCSSALHDSLLYFARFFNEWRATGEFRFIYLG